MLLELIGFFLIIILVLVLYSESTQQPAIGMLAGCVLLILSYWILTDDIQIKTGEVTLISTTSNQTGNVTGLDNVTGNVTNSGNVSAYLLYTNTLRNPNLRIVEATASATTDSYVTITATPYIVVKEFVGLLFVLLGLYGATTYALRFFNPKEG